jgi:hypothetical protein
MGWTLLLLTPLYFNQAAAIGNVVTAVPRLEELNCFERSTTYIMICYSDSRFTTDQQKSHDTLPLPQKILESVCGAEKSRVTHPPSASLEQLRDDLAFRPLRRFAILCTYYTKQLAVSSKILTLNDDPYRKLRQLGRQTVIWFDIIFVGFPRIAWFWNFHHYRIQRVNARIIVIEIDRGKEDTKRK